MCAADGERAYIDLLGVDSAKSVPIVETKIGSDVVLVAQGLDYWAPPQVDQDTTIAITRPAGTVMPVRSGPDELDGVVRARRSGRTFSC